MRGLILIRGILWGRQGKIAAREAAAARDAQRQLAKMAEKRKGAA